MSAKQAALPRNGQPLAKRFGTHGGASRKRVNMPKHSGAGTRSTRWGRRRRHEITCVDGLLIQGLIADEPPSVADLEPVVSYLVSVTSPGAPSERDNR